MSQSGTKIWRTWNRCQTPGAHQGRAGTPGPGRRDRTSVPSRWGNRSVLAVHPASLPLLPTRRLRQNDCRRLRRIVFVFVFVRKWRQDFRFIFAPKLTFRARAKKKNCAVTVTPPSLEVISRAYMHDCTLAGPQ